jgi:hypothetical protein
MNLDELIGAVEDGNDEPLDRISAAAALKDQIEQLGDELLDHFVKDARDAGCSWTQIGEALGVTRQAAQQRHGGLLGRIVEGLKAGKFQRFTKRARAAVVASQTAARDRQHDAVETEHLLLGLFAADEDDVGVAVVALANLGVDRATVEREVEQRMPSGERPVRGHIPFSAQSKKTLELALREALRLGHNYIGTEHIVLALRRVEEGGAAQIMAERGVTYRRLQTTVVGILSSMTAQPPADG